MLATAIFIGAAALLPGAPVARPVVHDGAAMSRRSALPLFGAGLALAALPTVVCADDDAVARIAARQNAAAQAERDANKPVVEREAGEGANLVRSACRFGLFLLCTWIRPSPLPQPCARLRGL